MSQRERLLADYRAGVGYVDREIVRLEPRRRDPEGKVRAARRFNRALGEPQRAFPSIQVAGTSGKGSVAWFLASALDAAGLRTGLHVSPYLQSFTEKTWIDGRYCSVEAFCDALERVRPVAEALRDEDRCPASVHGLASLGVTYVAFRDAAIDLAVVETGLGGRFDLVQNLRRELCVITELGLDHTTSLGPTLAEIAWHKAGIMEPGVPCVAARGAGWHVLEAEARRVGAPLHPIDLDSIYASDDGMLTLALGSLGEIALELGTRAPFVARNAALAAAALDRLAAAGWPVRAEHVQAGARARVPGRFELVQADPAVVLDCAHNAQKMGALCAALGDGGLTLVFAATGSRSPADLLERIAPRTACLVATELELYGKATVSAIETAAAARALGVATHVAPSPEGALTTAFEVTPRGRPIVIAGSVYLAGRLRDRWYPTDEVVLQRTSWPGPAGS